MSPTDQHDRTGEHDLRAASIEHRHGKVDRATFMRRRVVVGILVAVVAVGVVLLLALVWPGFARDSTAQPGATVTVTAAAPSPTASPVALPSGASPLLRSLAPAAGPYVRTKAATTTPPDGALEAWRLAYTGDGTDLTVTVAQWPDASGATHAYAAAVQAAGAPDARGDVAVGGKKAGSWASFAKGDTATRWWRNGSVVLSARGPAADVAAFYAAFPM